MRTHEVLLDATTRDVVLGPRGDGAGCGPRYTTRIGRHVRIARKVGSHAIARTPRPFVARSCLRSSVMAPAPPLSRGTFERMPRGLGLLARRRPTGVAFPPS